jgi:tetratricopeptide (TPR) repeat protein
LLEKAVALREAAAGGEDLGLAGILVHLGTSYRLHGDFGHAEPLYLRAMSIREKRLGPNDPVLGDSLFNLAALYRGEGRYAEAEPLARRELGIREAAYGPDNRNVIADVNGLGLILQGLGRSRKRSRSCSARSRRGNDCLGLLISRSRTRSSAWPDCSRPRAGLLTPCRWPSGRSRSTRNR